MGDLRAPVSTAIVPPPRPTGRRLVHFKRGVSAGDAQRVLRSTGASVVTPDASVLASVARSSHDIIGLERLGIAIVGGGLETSKSLGEQLMAHDEVADVRPEFWMFAIQGPPWQDSASTTWGIEATRAAGTGHDGNGIKVAVLDTGIDRSHPDFNHSAMITETFVEGETVDDVQGHGTHCAGTICGRPSSANVPRYGVAPGVILHVGKVLNNHGAGREGDIIAGMIWAMERGCEVISMSLGRGTMPNEPFDPLYESIAQDALDQGILIVAAAGNDSDRRWNYVAPVGAPANSPSIMAVAAIGADGGVASFSCGGVGTGQVDISAPGVGIFSAFAGVQTYKKLMGTSMACPHVAGLAALHAASAPQLRGQALWDHLVQNAVGLGGIPRDIGAGLAVI
jgi:subtilisin